jgi:hypothetical protein
VKVAAVALAALVLFAGWMLAGVVVLTMIDGATEGRFLRWFRECPSALLKQALLVGWPVLVLWVVIVWARSRSSERHADATPPPTA